jgi:hypothetical protein
MRVRLARRSVETSSLLRAKSSDLLPHSTLMACDSSFRHWMFLPMQLAQSYHRISLSCQPSPGKSARLERFAFLLASSRRVHLTRGASKEIACSSLTSLATCKKPRDFE